MTLQEFAFKSSSSPKTYRTLVNANGLLSCDCPGWTVKRANQPRHCKHTKQVASDLRLTLEERSGQMFIVAGGAAVNKAKAAPAVAPKAAPIPAADAPKTEKVEAQRERGFIEPMLASKMPDGWNADRYDERAFVLEEKYDGHRIVTTVSGGAVKAWSRLANARTLPTHIEALMAKMPDGTYDGELIVPGNKSYAVTAGVNTGKEALVLFDLIEVLGRPVVAETQDTRRKLLEVAYGMLDGTTGVSLSAQHAPSSGAVKAIWARGGEGAIIKSRTAKYQPGYRSGDWVKVKAVAAATLTIIGFEDGKSGPYSAVTLRDEHGIETTVKTLNNATLRAIAAHSAEFIGKRLVISYQEKTPAGKYRHPMWDHIAGDAE